MISLKMTDGEIRRVREKGTFPFAFTECMFAFPEELRSEALLPERLMYARVVQHFNHACFENRVWINQPNDTYDLMPPVPGVSLYLVLDLVARLFRAVSANLFYQRMSDGSWIVGVVRPLELAQTA